MNVRTVLASFLVLGIALAAPAPAAAHRLDEYLQATRLSVDVDRVGLEIDLTAGVHVAPGVFGWIDANRDGDVSDAEAKAYARQLLRSVTLSLDNRPLPVVFLDIRVPPFDEMSVGVGTIRVRATANVPDPGSGRHRLSYVNTHRSESSVYLVNVLAPSDHRIHIGGQQRDSAQHELTFDYDIAADASWHRVWWVLVGLAMVGVLGVTRRPRTASA